MDKIILILLCIVAGALLRHYKVAPAGSYQAINALLVNFFMPALILWQITQLTFNSRYIFPVLMAWIIFAAAFVFFKWIGKIKNIPPKSVATLIITGGISTISFLGFPIFEILYGKEGLQIGILMSQAGSFLIGITFGVVVASWYSSATPPSVKEIAGNVFKFPPFIAFIVALVLNKLGIHFPAAVNDILAKLSSPYLILALLSVGLQINLSGEEINYRLLGIGLFYKLLIAPAIIFILYFFVFRQPVTIVSISVMGAAIGPMNTAAIIAGRYNLDTKLASQMVAIGIPLSLLVVYIIHILMLQVS
jgi:malate permease and related proteins